MDVGHYQPMITAAQARVEHLNITTGVDWNIGCVLGDAGYASLTAETRAAHHPGHPPRTRRALRRFARRGLSAAPSEFRFAAAVTNPPRLHSRQRACVQVWIAAT
ncbi:MAG: hypothetical protein QOE71_748 [Pseudonocardiales bacterium]|nr:hypothetical protein [Pseudonocardiales bacterium]